jgi:P-type Ca2+ transporter type 2C
MNLTQIRDLIRNYSQGSGWEEVNKSFREYSVDKDALLEQLCHQDPARSMAMHGMNKIFAHEKDFEPTEFSLNKIEKCIVGVCVLQMLMWGLFVKNSYYVVEYLSVIIFLVFAKYLAVFLDRKADKQMQEAEKKKPKPEYIVIRDGKRVKIEECEIVVGDLVYLKAGIRIPVDGLMIKGSSLIVNEAAVLGEPQNSIKKPVDKLKDNHSCPLLLSHTNVINGWGWMAVISIGEKTSGYARQCVDAHQNFREEGFENLTRTKIEFLYIGYSKVFKNILIITSILIVFLLSVYFFRLKAEHNAILQISRYLMQGLIIVYFSQQFFVEKAYDKYFKFWFSELAIAGIYLNKPECFEEVQKIKTLIFNRADILTTNEYILQKLWLGNEVAEFEQNFEDLEITKPLQADEKTVEILTQAILGNIDEIMPNKIDRSFIRFLSSIVGITEEEMPDQLASHYDLSNFRCFANSDNKRMMTLIDKVSGDKKLLIKGDFEDLYRQCTFYINDEGNQVKIDNETRDRIRGEIMNAQTECMIPICIWFKDISQDDLKPQFQNDDSGGPSEEEFEEFLNDQAHLTLIAVALFKNPVNIWIPSCISKIHKTQIKTILASASNTGAYYAKEWGIINEGQEDEEIEGKEFYEKAKNNRFWLEHHIHHIRVMSNTTSLHKYYLTDSLQNLYERTMVISNKPDDLSSIRRAQIGVSCLELDNSNLLEDSSVILPKRGFLEVHNLFKYAWYMERCTKESYIYCISSMLSAVGLNFVFGLVRGDILFEPVHFLILLVIELVVSEFLFKSIVGLDENGGQIENDNMIRAQHQSPLESLEDTHSTIKTYSLDEKSRKIMRYHIMYTIIVPSSVVLFNLMPSPNGYYLSSEGLLARLTTGIPSLNSFLFLFFLISRLWSILNLRCHSPSTYSSTLKTPHFLSMACIVLAVGGLPYLVPGVTAVVQMQPLGVLEMLFCIMLGMGTLTVQLPMNGVWRERNSDGFRRGRHQNMREMQRLDFTNDFD